MRNLRLILVVLSSALLTACGAGITPATREIAVDTQSADRARASRYRVLYSFGISKVGHDGIAPLDPLLYRNGTFYGTTLYGGLSLKQRGNYGVVFGMSPAGQLRVLHRFTAGDGGDYPMGGVVALHGVLYGTTNSGGAYGYGAIYRLSTRGEFRVLYSFNFGPSSLCCAGPYGNLVAVNDTLYGTTIAGDAGDYGTVYSVSTRGEVHILHTFDGSDGAALVAGLLNVNGTLYGTTAGGGAHNKGTVFRITTSGAEKVLFSFGGADGGTPVAPLIAVGGRLYGTTVHGGSANLGTVFGMAMSGKDERVLHSFSHKHADGVRPMAGLIDVNGMLYGTTAYGGVFGPSALCNAYGCGTIFSITTSGKETLVHRFQDGDPNDGSDPMANLIEVAGKLYGTTEYGGFANLKCQSPCYYGTVFEFMPAPQQ